MPIQKPWSSATGSKLDEIPATSGIYELRNFGRTVYVGETNNLHRRVKEHVRDRSPSKFRYYQTGPLEDREQLEARHIERHREKTGSAPAWNEQEPEAGLNLKPLLAVGGAIGLATIIGSALGGDG